jgi:hypothetical protein
MHPVKSNCFGVISARRSGGRGNFFLVALSLLLTMAPWFILPAAADGWEFSKEISCTDIPFSGVRTGKCWVSQRRAFRGGEGQAWKQAYSDSTSEFSLGIYKTLSGNGFGMVPKDAIRWLQSADALRTVTAGADNWKVIESPAGVSLVAFEKADRHCLAFARNGPIAPGNSVSWILAGALCRVSKTPLPLTDVQFFLDSVVVRD